jgi:hypothetical protein
MASFLLLLLLLVVVSVLLPGSATATLRRPRVEVDEQGNVHIVTGNSSTQRVFINGVDVQAMAAEVSDVVAFKAKLDRQIRRTFERRLIDGSVAVAVSVFPADLDGDGDVDVVAGSYATAGRVVWYRNDGKGSFTRMQPDIGGGQKVHSVHAADLDNDGDLDVLAALQNDNKVVWFRNNGNGSFSPVVVITPAVLGPLSVYAADLDNDGDMDVLSASFNEGSVIWFENKATLA